MKVYDETTNEYLGIVYRSHGGWRAETPLFIISFHETQAEAEQWLRDRVTQRHT